MARMTKKRHEITLRHIFVAVGMLVIGSGALVYWLSRTAVQAPTTQDQTVVEPVAMVEMLNDVVETPIEPTATSPLHQTKTLQQILEESVAAQSGTYMISVREIGGQQRAADVQSDQLTVTASTYKMFVVYAALSLAEKGQLDLNTVVHQGSTISQCIEVAILQSENECIKAVGFYIGWQRITDMANTVGYSSVFLNNFNPDRSFNGNKFVNARDEALFLYDLQAGKLLNQSNTTYMLNLMKQQVHRSGIPAGSGGNPVANKPGWLDGIYYHDAGIVYTDSSTYVLVVMTENIGNWSGVQAVSNLVHSFMKS